MQASPSGQWLAQLEPDRLRRWEAQSRAAAKVIGTRDRVAAGEWVTLRAELPPATDVRWWRNGELVPGASGLVHEAKAQGGIEWWWVDYLTAHGQRRASTPWVLEVRPATSGLVNVSVRGWAGAGEESLIAGAVLQGSPARVLARAMGPALSSFGLPGAPTVRLALFDREMRPALPPVDYTEFAHSNGGLHPAIEAAARAFGAFHPTASRASGNDQMLYWTLPSGPVHVHVRAQEGPGVAMAELYVGGSSEFSGESRTMLSNVSGRARAGHGVQVLVAGFALAGEVEQRVLVRALGPRLKEFGLSQPLEQPRLQVYRGQTLLAENAGWDTTADPAELAMAAARAGAVPLLPGSRDAALLLQLRPGLHTVVVSPAGSAAPGVALVEVFLLD
jgi:hypothetical protein